MSISLEPLLHAGAHDLGIPLDATQTQKLLKLLTELTEWNTRFNLTAIRDPAEMLRKHLLDSLSVRSYIRGRTVADVGSGAGFPGLPLAVANPERRFTLIESTGKKAGFIQHAVEQLQLTNVEVVNARAEAYKPAQRYDAVISRALGKLGDFIRFTQHLCAPDGRLLAMKGQYPQAEIDALPKQWKVAVVHRLTIPGLEAERHLVELVRA